MSRQIRWIQDIEIVLGWPSNLVPWRRYHYFCQFWKLGFCSVSECPIFAHRVQLCKFLEHEHVASVPTWKPTKHACMTHQNPILMHSFHSMTRVGIQQVSWKSFRRWGSMCDKMMVVAWINEPLDPLDSGHRDSVRVAL